MYFDVAMPLTLFIVTIVAMFLDEKVEVKFKVVFEKRKLRVPDVILIVAVISIIVSLVVFIPQMAVMTLYLLAYSMLLFVFTYIFSDFQKAKAKLFCMAFLVLTFVAAIISMFNFGINSIVAYGALALFCLFGFTFMTLLHEENRVSTEERWYLAVLPPALFILLYIFFSRTPIWFPYLLNLYGIIFAVSVILFLGSLFTWKTSLIFVGLLTIMDVILVLYTGSMVSAATHVSGLRLPVLVLLPTFPAIVTEWGRLYMSLGVGDFFFVGLLAVQTHKKFGRDVAVLSAVTMSASFFVFEALLLTYSLGAFPGTLMIISGWLPVVLWKTLKS